MIGPILTAEHQALSILLGRWNGPEMCYPAPWDAEGGPAVGWVENHLTCSGFAVVQEYRQERAGRPSYEGHGIFRWDPEEKCYQMYWFDSGGLPPSVFRGQFAGGKLSMTCVMPEGQLRCSWEIAGDRNRFCMEAGDGVHWQPMLEGDYTRAK